MSKLVFFTDEDFKFCDMENRTEEEYAILFKEMNELSYYLKEIGVIGSSQIDENHPLSKLLTKSCT